MAKTDLPEAPFVLNTKTGKGYDSDILTIRGATWDEFEENVKKVLTDAEWDERLELFSKTPRDEVGAAPKRAGGGGGNNGGGDGDWKHKAPDCNHGQMQAREWKDRNQKTQHTYFCPQPREANDKCTPVDALTGKRWGEK